MCIWTSILLFTVLEFNFNSNIIYNYRKYSESANLRQAAILSLSCRIAKFGEEVLNHSRAIAREYFQYCGFDLEI